MSFQLLASIRHLTFFPPLITVLLMARRAKSSIKPVHLLVIAGVIAIVSIAGSFLLGHKSDGGFTGVTDLSLHEYLQNSNALSNNTYRIEGVVEERLDNWRSTEGRLFSVIVDQNGETSPLAVFVPIKFNGTNIQRGQRFKFKVVVQAESGVLEALEMTKS